jgi:hypothetical protein
MSTSKKLYTVAVSCLLVRLDTSTCVKGFLHVNSFLILTSEIQLITGYPPFFQLASTMQARRAAAPSHASFYIPLEKKLKDEPSVELIHTVPELTDL